MAVMRGIPLATVRRHTLADCGAGGIRAKILALGGRTAIASFNRIQTTPSQKEREKNKNKKAKGKNFLPHRQRIAKKNGVGKYYFGTD
jgi:hypothetical protein